MGEWLHKNDIRYVWAKELGNPHRTLEEFSLTNTVRFQLDAIIALYATENAALVCAELDYDKCHRKFLAEYLTDRGHSVYHIPSDDGQTRIESALHEIEV